MENGSFKQVDTLLITGATTGVVELKVDEIRLDGGRNVSAAEKGDVCSIPVNGKIRKNDKVYLFNPR